MSDFTLDNHGSILVLTPQNKPAMNWVDEHLLCQETQMWGKNGIVIEPRYWPDIERGINEDGLTVAS